MTKKPPDENQPALWDVPREPAARVQPAAALQQHRPTAAALVKRPVVPEDGLWGIEKLAEYLGVPKFTIYGWRKTGYGPPAIKVGKHLRWRAQAVHAWLREREASAS